MNEAWLILAEGNDKWLTESNIASVAVMSCPSLTCGVYIEPEIHPDPPERQRRCTGVSTAEGEREGDTDLCD